jgi:hypothetical protein
MRLSVKKSKLSIQSTNFEKDLYPKSFFSENAFFISRRGNAFKLVLLTKTQNINSTSLEEVMLLN